MRRSGPIQVHIVNLPGLSALWATLLPNCRPRYSITRNSTARTWESSSPSSDIIFSSVITRFKLAHKLHSSSDATQRYTRVILSLTSPGMCQLSMYTKSSTPLHPRCKPIYPAPSPITYTTGSPAIKPNGYPLSASQYTDKVTKVNAPVLRKKTKKNRPLNRRASSPAPLNCHS